MLTWKRVTCCVYCARWRDVGGECMTNVFGSHQWTDEGELF